MFNVNFCNTHIDNIQNTHRDTTSYRYRFELLYKDNNIKSAPWHNVMTRSWYRIFVRCTITANDLFLVEKNLHHLTGSLGNRCTRTEDGGNTGFIEEVVVLCGNHTTGNNHDVFTSKLLQFLNQLRYQGLVTSGEWRCTNNEVLLNYKI